MLSRGCLPPQLLREALATFNLLFPDPDDPLSQAILTREVATNELDEAFLEPFPSLWGTPKAARRLGPGRCSRPLSAVPILC